MSKLNRYQLAEVIWRAEYKRATGKERNVSFDEQSDETIQRYIYLADAIHKTEDGHE